jgi:sporulation protein YlmC with PRC-barrel domain
MRTRVALLALLVSSGLSAAVAQTTTTAPAPSAGATASVTTSGQWRTSKLIGLNVYNEQNEKLGDISEVLVDASGKVTGVVIGVGGFLGIGQRDIMVGMDKLKFVNEPMRTNTAANTAPATGGSAPTATTGTSATVGATERRWYPDHAILAGATKDSVKAMPEFKYN